MNTPRILIILFSVLGITSALALEIHWQEDFINSASPMAHFFSGQDTDITVMLKSSESDNDSIRYSFHLVSGAVTIPLLKDVPLTIHAGKNKGKYYAQIHLKLPEMKLKTMGVIKFWKQGSKIEENTSLTLWVYPPEMIFRQTIVANLRALTADGAIVARIGKTPALDGILGESNPSLPILSGNITFTPSRKIFIFMESDQDPEPNHFSIVQISRRIGNIQGVLITRTPSKYSAQINYADFDRFPKVLQMEIFSQVLENMRKEG